MADSESRKPNAFLVFLGSAVVLTIVIVSVSGLVGSKPKVETVDLKRGQLRIEAREKLDQANLEQLTTATWVDKEKGVVRLPVDRAMNLVAADLAGKKPAPSTVKVEPPLPMPPPYDPNAAEPAPGALPSSPQGSDTIRFDPPVEAPSASIAPVTETLTASVAPDRPPLVHWTEKSELKK